MRILRQQEMPAKPKLANRTDIIILFVLLAVPSLLSWRLLAQSEASVATSTQAAALDLPKSNDVPSGVTFRPIATARLGERVDGTNPNRDEVDLSLEEPNEETCRELALWMTKPDGKRLDIGLLRAVEWIEFNDARDGGQVYLDLPELGAVGWAEVVSIGPCPEIVSGPGSVITGTFRHESSNLILDITVDGDDEPIGVTDNHPFWSVDRQEFVQAGDLEVGETLNSLRGMMRITSIAPRGPPEPVYNLEVHGEHVYRVSTLGVLVHNCYHSVGRGPSGKKSAKTFLEKAWDKATFGAVKKSIEYHVAKHGKGLSAVQVTQRAKKAFADATAKRANRFDAQGRPALQVKSREGKGLFTVKGKIIWFEPS